MPSGDAGATPPPVGSEQHMNCLIDQGPIPKTSPALSSNKLHMLVTFCSLQGGGDRTQMLQEIASKSKYQQQISAEIVQQGPFLRQLAVGLGALELRGVDDVVAAGESQP